MPLDFLQDSLPGTSASVKLQNTSFVEFTSLQMPNLRSLRRDIVRPINDRESLAKRFGCDVATLDLIISSPASFYHAFTIPKKNSAGKRAIHAPSPTLRAVQREVLRLLHKLFRMPKYLHGGVHRRSILTHAAPHVNKHMVATLDIEQFFPSTTILHVRRVFEAAGLKGSVLEDLLALTTLARILHQ
jgi:RNA-directed DNA polymerase